MYEERWNCFMKTGRIRDYLEYKQELEKQLLHLRWQDD